MSPSAPDDEDESPSDAGMPLEWGRDGGSIEEGIERFFLAGQQEGLTFGGGSDEPSESLATQELRSVIDSFARDLGPRLGGRWEVPRRIGPYRLVHYAGHGGMGVVFKGIHQETGEAAAVKIVPETREDLVGALEREAASLATSRHPNIPEFFDSGRSGGYAWVASRWIHGQSLADRILERSTVREATPTPTPDSPATGSTGMGGASRPPGRRRPKADRDDLRNCVGWARDIARSLQAIHEEGRVHRDVKPSNLVVDDGGKIWLIDFGLAERAHGDSDDPLRFHLEGTVPYMSPEQTWGGRVGVGPPSDVYALAVTFHEIITGCRVVQTGGGGALREIALSQVPRLSELVGGIPEELDSIFAMATRKNPAERYRQAGQFADDLEDWLAGRAPRNAVARGERRAVLRDAVSLAVLLILTAVLAWAWAPTVAERRLEELAALVDEGRADEVYEALAREGGSLAGQPGFQALAERVIATVAPGRTQNLMLEPFPLAQHPELPSIRVTRAREARALLDLPIPPRSDLVAQLVFPNVIALSKDRAREALALLDRPQWRELSMASPLLLELRATAQVALGEWQAAQATLREMPRKVPDDIHLILESVRLKWAHFRFKKGKPGGGEVDDRRLERWRAVLDEELKRVRVPPGLLCAHSFVAQELGDPRAVIADYERIAAPWPPRSQEDLACHFYHAANLLAAGVDGGSRAHRHRREGLLKARLILDRFPRLGPELSKRIYFAADDHTVALVPIFEELFEGRRKMLGDALTQLVFRSVVGDCMSSSDTDAGERMFRLMESVWPDMEDDAFNSFFQATVFVAAMETEFSDGLDTRTRAQRYANALRILERIPENHRLFAWPRRFQIFQARVRLWSLETPRDEAERVRLMAIADALKEQIDDNVDDAALRDGYLRQHELYLKILESP